MQKAETSRVARASATVLLGQQAFDLVATDQIAKGDVLRVAQLAGVMGAKHTPTLIPLCHTILVTKVDVKLRLDASRAAVLITSEARAVGRTGKLSLLTLCCSKSIKLTCYISKPRSIHLYCVQ